MAMATVGLLSLPAFIPSGLTGSTSPEAPAAPALRGNTASGTSSSLGAGAVALTVLGAAAAKRVVARKAVRRELAVAYEDSGIDLLDNGKFAQGFLAL